jgi:hypothetical protein
LGPGFCATGSAGLADFFNGGGGGGRLQWPCSGFLSVPCGPIPQPPPPQKPKESFSVCFNREAASASIAGIIDEAFGTHLKESTAGELFLGNDILAFAGLVGLGPESGLGVAPTLGTEGAISGIGTPTTIGGNGQNAIRTLIRRVGRPPQALLRGKTARLLLGGLKGVKGALSGKLALDAGLVLGTALSCL